MSRVIDEHRRYLRDAHRVAAYERALHEVVKPGDVVVDLASGTGILGMLACRAGAARVYAVEHDGIAGLAAEIARANGLEGTIVGVRGQATTVTLRERADVIVTDQIGHFGLEADILDLTRDARARWLKPGGTLMPHRLDLVIAAVEHPRFHHRLQFWKSHPAGFDYAPAAAIAANTGSAARLRADHLLSAPVTAGAIDLHVDQPSPVRLSATLRASRAGVLHGIAGWFVARLAPHVTMTNSPLSAERINRRQLFFPIDRAVSVAAGTAVDVTIRMLPTDLIYAWHVEIAGAEGPPLTFRHSTLRGMLIGRDDLGWTHPGHRPVLTPAGDARLTVLRLCDGARTVQEIEQVVYDQHRALFGSRAQAATFVAEVVTRYSRA